MIETSDFKAIQTEYNRLYASEGIRDEDRAYVWHAGQLLKAKPGCKRVLDVACGAGYFLRELDRASAGHVAGTGIDISDTALTLAKKECPRGEFLHGIAEKLPFEDGVFDAVTCLGSLEHFLNIPAAVGEMIRVTKPDGIFYILVPNIFWYKDLFSVLLTGERVSRNQTQERFASWGEWKRTLEDAGLKVRRTNKYNGIAKRAIKQRIKDAVIPLRFSYHLIFLCEKGA